MVAMHSWMYMSVCEIGRSPGNKPICKAWHPITCVIPVYLVLPITFVKGSIYLALPIPLPGKTKKWLFGELFCGKPSNKPRPSIWRTESEHEEREFGVCEEETSWTSSAEHMTSVVSQLCAIQKGNLPMPELTTPNHWHSVPPGTATPLPHPARRAKPLDARVTTHCQPPPKWSHLSSQLGLC